MNALSLSDALRVCEALLGFAFALQSLEHLQSQPATRQLFALRLLLACLLISAWQSTGALLALLVLSLFILRRFQGPYNGGSDRMGLLILCCLLLTRVLPTQRWQEIALGYLAVQLLLSYFIAGWVKVVNPEWRSGQALRDVFEFSAYPVSDNLRRWSRAPRLLLIVSWAVMGFELLLPLSLLNHWTLYLALVLATCFHFANACLFGLNRFFWIWIAAYPALLWFQGRIFR